MKSGTIEPGTLAALAGLARGLCADDVLDVGDAARPHYDSARHRIGIDTITASRDKRARGILAHECGHVLLSRYHLWPVPNDRPGMWFKLLNALEDPRVDAWMARRYPGSRGWFDAVAHEVGGCPVRAPRSLFVQFTYGAALYGTAAEAEIRLVFDPGVVAALDDTRDARRRYVEAVPSPVLARAPAADAGRIDCISEAMVRDHALVAWRIARDEILPAAMAIADRDVRRVDDFAQRNPIAGTPLSGGDRRSRIDTVARALEETPPDAVPPDAPAVPSGAGSAFDDFIAELGGDLGGRAGPRVRAAASGEPDSPRGGDDAARDAARTCPEEIADQVAAMSATLERIMDERRRQRWRAAFRSGPRVDLSRLMRHAADRAEDRIWKRRPPPRDPEGAIGLLVDLSGSMSNNGKVDAAVRGTWLLAEAASRAGVEFGISGFQDELIPVAAFGEGLTPAARARIADMSLEAVDRRPGGHNQARWNDDGPCLSAFAQALLARPGRRHLLLVVSDGGPAGRRSNADDLRGAVARLSARRDLTLIGLGLGPGTDHVRDFYPIAVANVPTSRLAAEIGRLLLERFRRI